MAFDPGDGPIVDEIQVYGTASWLYVVGSSLSTSLHHILKIDRNPRDLTELSIAENSQALSTQELDDYLAVVSSTPEGLKLSNGTSSPSAVDSDFAISLRAVAIAGFIRFVEGWYMIVVVKATPVAELGYDKIFKVDDVVSVYIPFDDTSAKTNPDEQRYLRTFQLVDLSSHCYYSPTYNLSSTLQANVCETLNPESGVIRSPKRNSELLKRVTCNGRFVWNRHLLQPMLERNLHARWLTVLVHGFVGCKLFSHYGLSLSLILMSRRSNQYAGTRFLKRGCDYSGNVANEVETEQIIFDTSISNFTLGRYTSFVQLRGSIPVVWSQDQSKTVTKPPIALDLSDPYALYGSRHFTDLRARYGTPIVVVSLIKKRERRRQESILGEALRASVEYLNQFLPPKDRIVYWGFDMARCNKVANVYSRIEMIGEDVKKRTGFFQTSRPHISDLIRSDSNSLVADRLDRPENVIEQGGFHFGLQRGVVRSNCVDCLDRTNAAQLVIAQVLMAHQLYALGVTDAPAISSEPELQAALESLYELQGDALAMQYAGSQLVHSVKTYKKSSLFQEKSRDVIQTLSRYYSSNFSAADKQNALNLFLGVYIPDRNKTPLWDIPTDAYLHNEAPPPTMANDYCAWFDQKGMLDTNLRFTIHRPLFDPYELYYEPWAITSFDVIIPPRQKVVTHLTSAGGALGANAGVASLSKLFRKNPITGVESVLPADLTVVEPKSKSGFVHLISKEEKLSKSASTDSISTHTESDEEEIHSDIEVTGLQEEVLRSRGSASPPLHSPPIRDDHDITPGLSDVCPNTKDVYGFELEPPSTESLELYAKFAALSSAMAQCADGAPSAYATYYPSAGVTMVRPDPYDKFKSLVDYSQYFNVLPVVSPESIELYKKHVSISDGTVKCDPSQSAVDTFKAYLRGNR